MKQRLRVIIQHGVVWVTTSQHHTVSLLCYDNTGQLFNYAIVQKCFSK